MAYLGESTPKLGFGLMRLPKLEDGTDDLEQVKQMVDAFMEAGLTYFDTARAYGTSEETTRKALVERYPRDSFTIATKNAAWLGAKNEAEAKAFLQTSLDNLGVEYVDYYLIHNTGAPRTEVFDRYGMWDWGLARREEGLIRHLGFSHHGNAEELDALLKVHPEMEFVQLQINYADWDDGSIQSRACFEVCKRHGKPVVVMEPVRGGTLANPPQSVADVFARRAPGTTPVSWALRFVWGLDNLITVLSGMSTLQQMRQNIASYRAFEPFTAEERDILAEAQQTLADARLIPCTNCHYCMKGCPMEINIAGVMDSLNRESSFPGTGKRNYGFAVSSSGAASDCIECGQCEDACPQHIDIIDQLAKAAELFEGDDAA